MAALCDQVYCCSCDGHNRKIFHNFDGSVNVEPLVDYFKPTNSLATENLIRGMSIDRKVLKKGLTGVEQIAAVVNFAHDNNLRVRAVGTGSSWSELTTVRDILIDMTNLNKILNAKPQNTVSSIYHIEVQAGMILGDFVREIDRRYGMALPSMGAYDKQTVGGVVSTSTHGAGQDYQSMSTFVVELHMVISKGIQVKVRIPRDGENDEDFESVERRIQAAKYGDPTLDISSTDIFRAVAVGLGSLGVIYSVTFECIPVYNIKETRRYTELKWPSKKHSRKLKTPSELKELGSDPGKYLTILVNPYPRESAQNSGKTVLRSAYLFGERTDERNRRICRCKCCVECQCHNCCSCPDCSVSLLQTNCFVNCLQATSKCFPSCIPSFADIGMKEIVRPQDTPEIGKWYKILAFVNGSIQAREAGYCIPLEDKERALADIIQIMQDHFKYRVYFLLPIFVRIVKADDLYLSPMNRQRPDGRVIDHYFVVDVPILPGTYGKDEFHKKIEDHLFTHYQARPNWAKNHFLTFDRVGKLYPDLNKWKRVYLLFNSDGTFDNEFTLRVGFEDLRRSGNSTEKTHSDLSFLAEHHQLKGNAHVHQHHSLQEFSHDHRCTDHRRCQHVNVISSKVISSQPRKSEQFPPSIDYGRKHFIPIRTSQFRR